MRNGKQNGIGAAGVRVSGWLAAAAGAFVGVPAFGQSESAPSLNELIQEAQRLAEEVSQSGVGQEILGGGGGAAEPVEEAGGGAETAGEAVFDGVFRGAASGEPVIGEDEVSSGGGAVTEVDLSAFDGEISVSAYDLVDLHVVNEQLAAVLQLLSIQSQRNIVASSEVNAVVTADLYGVTFYDALDALLHVNGFGYIERGNYIMVYTQDQLAEIEQASRVRTSKVIRLDYLNAVDAGRFVAPLLSEGGTITTPGQTVDFNLPDDGPSGKDEYASDAVLVIHDYEENIEEIEALIGEIDTRPAQVLVEATILQTSLTEANAFGVDFSLIADLDFTDFISPLDATDALIGGRGSQLLAGAETPTALPADQNGRSVTSSVGQVSGEAGIRAGIVSEDIAVFLRALDEVTDITVISNPKVLTLNRQQARVLVGTRVGFLNTTTTETATTQTVEFLDTGTQLHVRPFVTSDGLIRMELKPQVSTATPRAVTSAQGQSVTIPDEDTTELVTNLLVRDGQTIVLGGLFTETTTATRRQVPVLGDIPLIGAAFRGHDDSTRRSEIIFLITPSIVSDEILTLEGETATAYVEHARAGARRGLLPWSRERQVGQLLIEARELAADGQTKRAQLKVERALTLAPQSPDALALREELTNDAIRWPKRSMLEGILNDRVRDFQREQGAIGPVDEVVEPARVPDAEVSDAGGDASTDWLLGSADAGAAVEGFDDDGGPVWPAELIQSGLFMAPVGPFGGPVFWDGFGAMDAEPVTSVPVDP